MDKLIATIQKFKPFFDNVARNKYLKAIKDGFISCMPIVIFSSIFLLVAYVPNIWGFTWPPELEAIITKPYGYSMGILSVVVAATTAKHFTDSLNRDMPRNNQINFLSTMVCATVGLFILASDPLEGGFASDCLGSKGLLTAFIAAFVVGGIYKFCVSRNITIHMPEQVPPNISQTFKDIIPFSLSVILFWLVDLAVRTLTGSCVAEGVIQLFQPIFSAADSYLGIAIIYGAMSLFWFVGVHGPSIVEPAVEVALLAGMTENLAAFQAGQHATHALSLDLQFFVVTMGGTGATLVPCMMFAFLARSKELRAVGRASAVPVTFGVNEPFLFGAPMVLNPVFLIPFVVAPVANAWVFKLFIDVLGMNGFLYTLPWTTPAPLGIVLGCGLSPLSFVFVAVALVMDFVIYYPFFKMYDLEKCEEEAQIEAEELEARAADKAARMSDAFQGKAPATAVATAAPAKASVASPAASTASAGSLEGKKVLVLCAGGGTSGLLANALAKAADEHGIDLESAAGSYGAHLDIMPDFDLVVLAPQVASYLEDLKIDADRMGVKVAACEGRQYIALTRNGEEALSFVSDHLSK
ncbi:MAG: PTS transporter subunit EIIC [Atopobiaceae bacterium]|nr:PTS transporter subunit EIIC [Atopobiaceae bacterium]